jgi:hypothetical protein
VYRNLPQEAPNHSGEGRSDLYSAQARLHDPAAYRARHGTIQLSPVNASVLDHLYSAMKFYLGPVKRKVSQRSCQ